MPKLLRTALLAGSLAAQGLSVNGNWTGAIRPGGTALHFQVHLEPGGGSWDSVDQHVSVPVKSVAVSGNAVTVDFGYGKFEGTLAATGDRIDGKFKQNSAEFPLLLQKIAGEFPPPKGRPQDPVKPYPYSEEEVVVPAAGGLKLAGTLTIPKQGGPFATALLLTGSGPQDRDEALMGHRPFFVLADFLTRAGFAVLRLDDRGNGKSEGVFATATYMDKVADVQAAVKFLKARPDIDSGRVGLIGHSEGGVVGPLAAAESKEIAFVVMMAGIGIKGPDLLKQQAIDVARAAGATDAQIAANSQLQQKLIAIYTAPGNVADKRKQARALFATPAQAELQIHAIESSTMQDILTYDAGPVLRKLSCPVLALNGSLDTQVSAKLNLPAIALALAESGSRDWQVMELPQLNHLFQTAKTGGVGEYAAIEETIAPLALTAVKDWLGLRFLPRK